MEIVCSHQKLYFQRIFNGLEKFSQDKDWKGPDNTFSVYFTILIHRHAYGK